MGNKMPISTLAIVVSGILAWEGYTMIANVPVPGDPPTIGHGTTVYSDGTLVKAGDMITPKQAMEELIIHVERTAEEFEKSIPGVNLTQEEYDIYLDFIYQFGITNWRQSSMRRHLISGEYIESCNALLKWRNVRGADCSLPKNWFGSGQDCRGVWLRQLKRNHDCLSANGVSP